MSKSRFVGLSKRDDENKLCLVNLVSLYDVGVLKTFQNIFKCVHV